MTITVEPIATLARNWWAIALRGAIALLLGIAAILLPIATLAGLVLLLAVYFIADGIFSLIAGFRTSRHDERRWPLLLEGILDLIAGVIAFLWPVITILVLVALLSVWSIVTGAVMLYGAIRGDHGHVRWLLGINGVLSILLGIAIVIYPAAGVLTIAWLVGIYALLFGIGMLVLGFRLKRMRDFPGPASAVRQV